MSDADAVIPAYSLESAVLKLSEVPSLKDMSADWAFGGATGAGVRVAVIDSGIEADHPDLGNCVEVASGVAVELDAEQNPIVVGGPHDDLFGHGTACAGIIHSLAPEARITSVRVLDRRLQGKANVFLRGLEWAIDSGFDVINLSLSTKRHDLSLAFYEACDRAYFSNSVIVAAANNANAPGYPSMFASLISVACSLTTDPFRYHYNPNPPTEFLARGINVEVAWKGAAHIVTTGNSFATPHMAGFAALVRSKHPLLRPFQVKTALWAAAANVREAPRPAGRLSLVARRSRIAIPSVSVNRTTPPG